MLRTPFKMLAIAAVIAGTGCYTAWARDTLTIKIPKRSELTPVQRLNREGVEAVKKRQYDKAEALFYKAYLFDPADPFTLNNLGYVAELQGQLDRAQKFYELASQQGSNANIDLSNVKQLQGKPMLSAFHNLRDVPMQVNRINIAAMQLLAEGRGFEAAALLEQAKSLDPQNPFTLNNLGVAHEAIGDYEGALRYYSAAANLRSSESAVVTEDRAWRGKSVSAMAAKSYERLRKAQTADATGTQAAMFSLRGVYAADQNDWTMAREDFLHAYSLDPDSAFSLNNRGYVAEMDGDLETAQFFYQKAKRAPDASARIGLATRRSAEGGILSSVAIDSNGKVDEQLVKYSEERHKETGTIELTPRDNAPDGNSTVTPKAPASPNPPSTEPSSPAALPPQ